MFLNHALKSQYHAALKVLRLAMEMCPEGMWDRAEDGRNRFWRVAYHTLFFTHLYLGKDAESFVPSPLHEDGMMDLGDEVDENGKPVKTSSTLTRAQLLAYWDQVDAMVDPAVDQLDVSRADSGFSWYPISKLEHQLVNLRHIQHHAAALSTRLRLGAMPPVAVPWVGRTKK